MKKYSAKETYEKRKIMNMSLEQYTQYRANQRRKKQTSEQRRLLAEDRKKDFIAEFNNPLKMRLLNLCAPWVCENRFRLYMTYEAWEMIFPLTDADPFEKNRIRESSTFIESNRWISSYEPAQYVVNTFWTRASTKD